VIEVGGLKRGEYVIVGIATLYDLVDELLVVLAVVVHKFNPYLLVLLLLFLCPCFKL
jgi:hypothetical protein